MTSCVSTWRRTSTRTEFDFRIYTILDHGNFALTFGRYSVRDGGRVVEKGVFCVSELRDEKLVSWEAFEHVAEAFHEYRQRLSRRT
jgi:limonene-1,2-epoxide hydrolase